MKIPSLALACLLLSCTALIPASFAQSPSAQDRGPNATTPSEPSPSSSTATSRTGASAQSAYRDDEDDDDDDDHGMGSRSGPRDRWGGGGWRDDRRTEMRDRLMDMRDRRMGGRDMDDRDMAGGMDDRRTRLDPALIRMHMRMMAGSRQGGARLQLKRGDASMDIRCPASEQIGACIDAVGRLMDRLQAMQQTR